MSSKRNPDLATIHRNGRQRTVHPSFSVQHQHTPRAECYRCFKPQVTCICRSGRRIANQTGVIILQHPRERFHAIGTVAIARLELERVRVEECAPWIDMAPVSRSLPERTALLYPSPQARDLGEMPAVDRPQHLLVLDGTWWQARKIYQAHTWLQALPHVRLTPAEPSRYRGLRREPKEHYVATLEAIVYALRILEPQTADLDNLLQSFAAMVARQASYLPAAMP